MRNLPKVNKCDIAKEKRTQSGSKKTMQNKNKSKYLKYIFNLTDGS